MPCGMLPVMAFLHGLVQAVAQIRFSGKSDKDPTNSPHYMMQVIRSNLHVHIVYLIHIGFYSNKLCCKQTIKQNNWQGTMCVRVPSRYVELWRK